MATSTLALKYPDLLLENLARGHVGGVGQPPHQSDVHGAPIDPPQRGNLFGARVVGQNPRQPLSEGENGLGGVLRTGGGSSGPKELPNQRARRSMTPQKRGTLTFGSFKWTSIMHFTPR